MSLRYLFIASAVVGILFGLGFLLFPDQLLQLYGVQLSEAGLQIARLMGSAFIGLGIITWQARYSHDSAARRAIVTGLFIDFLLGFIVSIMIMVSGIVNALGWSTVIIYLLFTLAYGYFQFIKREDS